LAIDVYSRMVVGFCISLDPPGAISTGLCIAHAFSARCTAMGWTSIRGALAIAQRYVDGEITIDTMTAAIMALSTNGSPRRS
jgi:hypothetical protein